MTARDTRWGKPIPAEFEITVLDEAIRDLFVEFLATRGLGLTESWSSPDGLPAYILDTIPRVPDVADLLTDNLFRIECHDGPKRGRTLPLYYDGYGRPAERVRVDGAVYRLHQDQRTSMRRYYHVPTDGAPE